MAIASHTVYTQEIVDSLKTQGEEAVKLFTADLIPETILEQVLLVAASEVEKKQIDLNSYRLIAELIVPFSPFPIVPLLEFLQTNKAFGLYSSADSTLGYTTKEFRNILDNQFNEYIEEGISKIFDDVENNMPGFIENIVEKQDRNFRKELSQLTGVEVSTDLANVIAGILTGKLPIEDYI